MANKLILLAQIKGGLALNQNVSSLVSAYEADKAVAAAVTGADQAAVGDALSALKSSIDTINAKQTVDYVRMTYAYNNATHPTSIANRASLIPENCTVVDGQNAIPVYVNLSDGTYTPALTSTGAPIFYNWTTNAYTSTPFYVVNEAAEGDTLEYKLASEGNVNVTMLTRCSFTFENAPVDYLLDNVEFAQLFTSLTVEKLKNSVANNREIIDQIKALVGDEAVTDAITQITDGLTNRIVALENKVGAVENVGQAIEDAKTQVFKATKTSLATSDSDTIANYFTTNSSVTYKTGDIFVVTTTVDSVDYGVTGYTYDGTNWIAMNGIVDADKVILRDNITLAGNYTAVGNLTKTSTGTATFATKGISVYDALVEIFSKRLQPGTPTEPAVSGFALTGAGVVEAGTKVATAQFGTAKLSAGSYTYGPATGITANSWSVNRVAVPTSFNATGVASAASGTDNNGGNGFIIGDQGGANVVSSLKYVATATYSAGAIANDNLGSASNPTVRIAAGSKSQTTTAYTPFRKYFYGASAAATSTAVNSAFIRGLTNSTAAYSAKTITVTAKAGDTRVVVACINGKTGVTKVLNKTSMNADITSAFVKSTGVKVEGANGYTAVDYNVWCFTPATPFEKDNVLEITLG